MQYHTVSGKLPLWLQILDKGENVFQISRSLVYDDNHKLRRKKVLLNLSLGVFAANEVSKCYILQSTFVIYQLG
jgi:hypothetical protein